MLYVVCCIYVCNVVCLRICDDVIDVSVFCWQNKIDQVKGELLLILFIIIENRIPYRRHRYVYLI